MKKIGLVIQGPLMSIGRTGQHMRQSVEELRKIGGVVNYDCRDNINKIIAEFGHLFDEIVVSTWDNEVKEGENFPKAKLVSQPDPGGIKQENHYKDNNKYRQFLSTHLGLVELEKSDIKYAIKTRTDIHLDLEKVVKDFFQKIKNYPNEDAIGATVVHPETFLLHDLYFMANLKELKKFCEAILAYDRFEFISSVHREMILKHAYAEYSDKIGVPDWAYFPIYPPSGVCSETRKIFDYMFKNVYFSIDPDVFRSTQWRGTYFEEEHVASLVNPDNRKYGKYNIPAFASIDWDRYFHFRKQEMKKEISLADQTLIKSGKLGWNLWQSLHSVGRKVLGVIR